MVQFSKELSEYYVILTRRNPPTAYMNVKLTTRFIHLQCDLCGVKKQSSCGKEAEKMLWHVKCMEALSGSKLYSVVSVSTVSQTVLLLFYKKDRGDILGVCLK